MFEAIIFKFVDEIQRIPIHIYRIDEFRFLLTRLNCTERMMVIGRIICAYVMNFLDRSTNLHATPQFKGPEPASHHQRVSIVHKLSTGFHRPCIGPRR